MGRYARLAAAVAALFTLAGCGGVGAPNDVVGAWTGITRDAYENPIGTLNIVIAGDSTGTITGTATDIALASTGINVQGSLSRNMNLTLTYAYPGGAATGHGVLANSNGTLSGYLDIVRPGQTEVQRVLVTLTPTGSGSGGTTLSPFAGTWSGAWSDATNAQQGTEQLTIGATGTISGTIHNTTLGTDGSVAGTVDSSGALDGTYTYPTATYTVRGTVGVGSNGHLTGTINEFLSGVLVGSQSLNLTKQ